MSGRPRRGFTLLEVLLVVAVAGLVVASVAGGLVGSGGEDAPAALAERLRSVDRQLRQSAERSGDPLRVHVLGDGWYREAAHGRRIRLVAWDDDLRVRCRNADGEPVASYRIDAAGRSHDLVVEVWRPGGERLGFQLLGLSGQWWREPR